MQMLLVTIELLRPVISIGAFVIMCVLPLHVYLLTVSGSCFFCFSLWCLCSLSDGCVLYSKPDAHTAYAKLIMMVLAVS